MAEPPGRTEAHILIVDDDPHVRDGLRDILEFEGYRAAEAGDGRTALDRLAADPPDLVLLDLKLPRVGGMEVLRQTVDTHPAIPVVIISGEGTIATAVEATKLGAYDFLEKPVAAQRALLTVRNALDKATLQRQRDRLLDAARDRYRMVGTSAAMQRVFDRIDAAARTQSKVLLTGESGTGKELVARAIHHNSDRAGGPFVAVNCAAVPTDLIESELFGHEKGAFTGAQSTRRGTFEQADGGTLLLDEVGDMSPAVQAKVLRVLEEGAVRPVGSETPVPVDVRIVAATSQDLETAVRTGGFREDLYYRINVLRIHLPPLRERRDDVGPLARHFLEQHSARHGSPSRDLDPAAMALLRRHDWPGNVRELRSVIERLLALTPEGPLTASHVRQALDPTGPMPVRGADLPTYDLRAAREAFERAHIRAVLRAHDGEIQATADALGIDRSHLWKKMQRYGIEGP